MTWNLSFVKKVRDEVTRLVEVSVRLDGVPRAPERRGAMLRVLAIALAMALVSACAGFGDDPPDTAPSKVQTKYGNGGPGTRS